MTDEIHIGDVGNRITTTVTRNDVALDISGYTIHNMIFSCPEKRYKITRTGTFTTTGVDGKLLYDFVDGDLAINTDGVWGVQVYLQNGSGSKLFSSIANFTVYPNL